MKKSTFGAFILGSAIIWAAVIIGCASALKGTECYGNIQNILLVGIFSHVIIIWGPMVAMLNKQHKQEK